MATSRNRGSLSLTYKVISSFLLCRICISYGSPVLLCPGRSEVGSSAHLICSTDTVNTTLVYTDPNTTEIHCDLEQLFCPNTAKCKNCNASVLNKTHSQVVIKNVQPSHGGVWTCRDDKTNAEQTCNVTVTSDTIPPWTPSGVMTTVGGAVVSIIVSIIIVSLVWSRKRHPRPSQRRPGSPLVPDGVEYASVYDVLSRNQAVAPFAATDAVCWAKNNVQEGVGEYAHAKDPEAVHDVVVQWIVPEDNDEQ